MLAINTRLKPIVDIFNRLSGWLLFLAIIWLCWVMARLLWLLLAPPVAPALPLVPIQNTAVSNADNSSLFAVFADPTPAQAPVQPPPNVVLKGVLLAVPDSLSSALLDVNGEVKNYRIGDALADSGYSLVAVDWNAVVIADSRDQQSIISMADAMALDQRGMDNGAIANQRLPDNNMTAALPMDTPMLDPNADDLNANSANAPTETPNSAIDEAVTALQENPASYLSRMGVMASGDGYQVTAAMPAGMRSRLGLEPGDKVLSVNGQSVGNSPAEDASVLQQVQQSGSAQIEVQRGDQTITIRQQF